MQREFTLSNVLGCLTSSVASPFGFDALLGDSMHFLSGFSCSLASELDRKCHADFHEFFIYIRFEASDIVATWVTWLELMELHY